MNLEKAEYLALNKMAEHGLREWDFKWSNAKTIYGQCDYTKRTIILSKILTSIVSEAHVLDTILHEIAHALVGPGNNHNHIWKAKAKELGCTPNTGSDTVIPDAKLPPKWVMLFEGEIVHRWMRKKNKKTFCGNLNS